MRAERIYLDITKDRIIVVERALHSSFSPIIKISRIIKFIEQWPSNRQNSWNKIYHFGMQ